ncbi:hypothetical protein [Psychrobacter sp. WY6]|uniref:hypothetical protein n=1 Tax=Psychrobacter sp. WY6 TaxID=2708350 RepID=UPI002022C368|nr:hypothetical protein [Psychrobacter sp. WY6]
MSVKFFFDSNVDDAAKLLCHEYWSYVSPSNYIRHLNKLCYDYDVSPKDLFTNLAKCQAYLDEIHCEYCGLGYRLDVPADISYIKKQEFWFCDGCINFSGGQLIVGR